MEDYKKQNVIIFGLGNAFDGLKEYIEEKYFIIAYTSNNEQDKSQLLDEKMFILPIDIVKYEYDFIIICSSYFEEIKRQLIETIGISNSKIKCLYNPSKKERIIHKRMSDKEFVANVKEYERLNTRTNFNIKENKLHLCLNDKYDQAGRLDEEYFLQDIWAAKKILKNNPQNHYDVGSRLDGFISHLLVFRDEVTLIDIRPLEQTIYGINFIEADATNMLGIKDNSIESLSSLSAVEHFGLGRYGDPIDPEGSFKAMKAFQRVIEPNGKLYFAVPVGSEDVLCFNAHRIFNPLNIIEQFDKMKLVEFSYISNYEIHNVSLENIKDKINEIPEYSAGLFEFVKEV